MNEFEGRYYSLKLTILGERKATGDMSFIGRDVSEQLEETWFLLFSLSSAHGGLVQSRYDIVILANVGGCQPAQLVYQ